ncbi:MAG: hypothetical protein DRN17_03565 [Thermoplasmata archaeon]|nr:MAG: hypothetical protein DRN17_03565 [Thermoplasmata archaeon]
MTPNELREAASILLAAADGKQIQTKAPCMEWIDTSILFFNFGAQEYRIKPEPQEFWLNVYPNHVMAHLTRDNAFTAFVKGGEIVHVREVT